MLCYNQIMKNRIECDRLDICPLSIEEMRRLQKDNQTTAVKSVLSEVIKSAIAHKIERMGKAPIEAHPWLTYWLATEKTSGAGIGLIGTKSLPDLKGSVEIGYAIAREYRNCGYLTEALTGFLDWLYECPFCESATLAIRSANAPSARVAEKCGFQFEGMRDIYKIYRYWL